MWVVVLATQKGGAGKTTLAGHLAVQAELSGAGRVAMIDADPQGSLAAWWNARQADTPVLSSIERGIGRALTGLRDSGVGLVVIDTPGTADAAISKIIGLSDLVLVPVVPSPHDLRAIGATITAIDKQSVPMVFVVNNAGAGRLTKEAAIALSQHGTVAPAICRTRQDWRASMVRGLTVMETTPNGRSAAEAAELWAYVQSILKRGEEGRGRKTKL